MVNICLKLHTSLFLNLKDVESTLMDKKDKPSGKLTVTTVVSFGTTWLTPRIQEFMKLKS